MPKALERKLMRKAKKMGLTGERKNAYVYGNKTMQKYLNRKKHKR